MRTHEALPSKISPRCHGILGCINQVLNSPRGVRLSIQTSTINTANPSHPIVTRETLPRRREPVSESFIAVLDSIEEVDDDIVLVDGLVVEMPTDGRKESVLRLSVPMRSRLFTDSSRQDGCGVGGARRRGAKEVGRPVLLEKGNRHLVPCDAYTILLRLCRSRHQKVGMSVGTQVGMSEYVLSGLAIFMRRNLLKKEKRSGDEAWGSVVLRLSLPFSWVGKSLAPTNLWQHNSPDLQQCQRENGLQSRGTADISHVLEGYSEP